MLTIIRGTTPTIRFRFKTITPNQIIAAYLCIRQHDRTIIEKDMSNATVGEEYLSFKLSQEDTLKLCRHHEGAIGLDWKASDNTRGRSKILIFKTEDSGKDETI